MSKELDEKPKVNPNELTTSKRKRPNKVMVINMIIH